MKRIAFVLFLILAISFVTQAQKPYSMESLEKVSQEELDVYFNKALKLQKDGKKVTKIGAITSASGAALMVSPLLIDDLGMGTFVIGFLAGVAGLGTMAVGIPMNKTGKKRVERINTIQNTAYDGIQLNVQPCAQYDLVTQNYQTGITLKIRF